MFGRIVGLTPDIDSFVMLIFFYLRIFNKLITQQDTMSSRLVKGICRELCFKFHSDNKFIDASLVTCTEKFISLWILFRAGPHLNFFVKASD